MSYVQTVLIAGGDDAGMAALNALLRPRDEGEPEFRVHQFTNLASIEASEFWGGYKYPECNLWACAFNYGPTMDELIEMVQEVEWNDWSRVQVFYNAQEDPEFQVWPEPVTPPTARDCECPHCNGDHGPWYPELPADYEQVMTPGHKLTNEQIAAEVEAGARFNADALITGDTP